ncbi:peptidoglycan DD-metalloendopeptidase family protein [Ascidiaceihabitans sp.]|nr:peptidoglycan DD-metalloendopeptidase family protein [Ascidiaceihabitans sp.]MDA9136275.1 peptidoglycan DD-metalloendopeptidase family protein [Ascidiaceihabitans sp.]
MKKLILIVSLLIPHIGFAQDAGADAREALRDLVAASIKLDQSDGARDRVKALTETILAFESGLTATRDSLRRAAVREEQLSRKLEARDSETAAFIGVLQSLGAGPSPTIFLHPQGPTGTARAGMLLSEMTPVLNARAAQLRQEVEEVQMLRLLQQEAADQLQLGLSEVQSARVALSTAIAERTDLPRRFTEDPVRTAILISSSETLEGFASGLSQVTENETEIDLPSLDDRIGSLQLPVKGLLLRGMNEADAAGIARPGIILATRPGALVHAPTAATIRYVGPLLDYGNVMILEPQTDILFVFAGLDITYGKMGQVITEGTPLGLMGGLKITASADNTNTGLSTVGDGAGNGRSETLYIEVRQQNVPQDPVSWFRTDKDG